MCACGWPLMERTAEYSVYAHTLCYTEQKLLFRFMPTAHVHEM
jgi:hypothetical protein